MSGGVELASEVLFQSRNPGDESRTAIDSVSPARFRWLIEEADRVGLTRLPERVADDPSLCPAYATDHATVTTTIYADERVTRAVHYTGCRVPAPDYRMPAPLAAGLAFYAAVDSAAGASRWIRPAPFR